MTQNINLKNIKIRIGNMHPIMYFLILSISTFFLVEILNDDMWFFEEQKFRILFMLINIVVYWVIYLFTYAVTCSVKVTSIVWLSIFNIVGMANYFVCEFRGVALRLSDFFSVGTAANVASMYKFKIGKAHIIWVLILSIVIVFVKVYLENKKEIEKSTIKYRISGVALWSFILIMIVGFDYSELGVNTFDGWNYGGYVLYFLDTMSLHGIKEPEGYEREKYGDVGRIIENIEDKNLPNIIVIMNESFCDPQRIIKFDTNTEPLPFFHKIIQGDNIIEGDAYVSVYAGGTANTEMEFLTASSLGFWGTNDTCYSIGYKNDLNVLPNWLNELGYETYAMHPANGDNYSRRIVYEKMRFKRKEFVDDFLKFGVETVKWSKANSYIKDFVNDSEDYRVVKSIINEQTKPVFIFNTTIQNHGDYNWRGIDDVKITNKMSDSENFSLVNEYLTLLNQSDKALEELITNLKSLDEDTIVLFFGDHQPYITSILYDELSPDMYKKDYFNVPFFIWANYDIKTKHNVKTSINYLQNILLESSEIGLVNKYQQYVTEVQKEYPILSPVYTEDKDGNEVDFYEIFEKNAMIKEYYKQAYKLIYDSEEK